MAGQHRTTRNKVLELLDAQITRVMAAYRRTGPQGSIFNIKQKGPPDHGTNRGRSEKNGW